MLDEILRALGRGLLAVITGLWNAIIMPILHGIGHGMGNLARVMIPWAIGIGGLWLLIVFKPEVANLALQVLILVGVVYAGFRIMFRRPGGQQQNRRRH